MEFHKNLEKVGLITYGVDQMNWENILKIRGRTDDGRESRS